MNIYDDFFNLEKPCPDIISNCSQMRDEYKHEIHTLRALGCRSCDEQRIKVKYMEILWKQYIKSI